MCSRNECFPLIFTPYLRSPAILENQQRRTPLTLFSYLANLLGRIFTLLQKYHQLSLRPEQTAFLVHQCLEPWCLIVRGGSISSIGLFIMSNREERGTKSMFCKS